METEAWRDEVTCWMFTTVKRQIWGRYLAGRPLSTHHSRICTHRCIQVLPSLDHSCQLYKTGAAVSSSLLSPSFSVNLSRASSGHASSMQMAFPAAEGACSLSQHLTKVLLRHIWLSMWNIGSGGGNFIVNSNVVTLLNMRN